MTNSSKVTTRSRARGGRQKPSKSAANNVEFHSILRIRPLLKKEKEDHVVLEQAKTKPDAGPVAVLHPMVHLSSPEPSTKRLSGNLSSPKFIQQGRQEEFHFDKILDANSSQDNVYYSIGLTMATNAMEPLKKNSHVSHVYNHVALIMGVSNAGKTHTTFGSLKALGRPGRHEEDGLVPRIIESLFSQSKHHVSHKASFAVRMTMFHVENDKVHDLLMEDVVATPPSTKKKSAVMAMVASFEGGSDRKAQVKIEQDPTTHDYVPNATVKTCWSAAEARELLQSGLTRGLSSRFAGFGKANSRGHTLITMQPVLIRGSKRDSTAVDRCGGTIAFLDMAGMERAKKSSRPSGGAIRDCVASNSSWSAVFHCLRGIKHNRDVLSGKVPVNTSNEDEDTLDGSEVSDKANRTLKAVPYRQSKVTMLLQPLFSHTAEWNLDIEKATTVVTTIITAYPGHRDYAEKRSLLNDMELLLGSEIAKRTPQAASTGLDTLKEIDRTMEDTFEGSEETSSLESDENDASLHRSRHDPPFRSPPIPPVQPTAPVQHYDVEAIPVSLEEINEPLPPPYAPGSKASIFSEASAPPIDEVYPDVGTPIVPTPWAYSPALMVPSSQRRACVVDLPGVPLPQKTPPVVPITRKLHTTPQSTQLTPHVQSAAKAVPTPGYISPPIANSLYKSSTHKATVSATPNIQPPSSASKTKPLLGSMQKDTDRGWMNTSPMKTIYRAVDSTKKHGKRAIHKVDKIVDRTVTRRMSNEFEPMKGASNDALMHRVKDLEKQNAKLYEENKILDEKCEELMTENKKLRLAMQEAKMKWRKEIWTDQDEHEWQHSKRLRVDEQRLIRSPLRQHLENVQFTDDINNKWMNSGKDPFSLQFPSHWARASELDQRDRVLEGIIAPQGTLAAAPSSSQKRDQVSAFKRSLNIEANKRNKRG